MLKEIVLLTGQAAQQLALTRLLQAHNPELSFRYALTLADLQALDPDTLAHSRLLAFTTGTIVPAKILNALGHGAYNFHPGSPGYPGWAPAHFALYEGAKRFGATAHVMAECVDSGPIIGTETFAVPDNIGVRELEQIAFVRLAYLFWRLSKELATRAEPMTILPIEWTGMKSTRRMYVSMCRLPQDISRSELELRVRAFSDDFRGIHPTINLHGFDFRCVATAPANMRPAMPDPRLQLQPARYAPPIAMVPA
jgi:methionyl-tRNA formyltransferase